MSSTVGPVTLGTLVRARAPLRISFCGGGTDLLPYAAERGGLVVNATIARHAWVTLEALTEQTIHVRSGDLGVLAEYGLDDPGDGRLALIEACLRRLRVGPEVRRQGLALDLETEAPPGSGLGASSALVVAIIGAFAQWQGFDLGPYEIADLAYEVERKDAGIAGGMQDQYAAAFGGFNLIEFRGEHDVTVSPLPVATGTVRALERSSLLVFTGGTRQSGGAIRSRVAGYRGGSRTVRGALDQMKVLAHEARGALVQGRLEDLAHILHEEWLCKRATSSSVSTPHIDHLYGEARAAGAVGGKVSGAGGGGFLFLLAPAEHRGEVEQRLVDLGARVSPVEFTPAGLTSWVEGARETP